MPECNLKNENCKLRCTGYDGGDVWAELHALPKKIGCESCAEEADSLLRGVHDVVNVGLGKKAYDAQNFDAFVDKVNCVYATCKKEGRC